MGFRRLSTTSAKGEQAATKHSTANPMDRNDLNQLCPSPCDQDDGSLFQRVILMPSSAA